MAAIIEVKDLVKVFDEKIRAVDGITFDVQEGEIFGFLGPNGAGKSTTINMLVTLHRPTSGVALVMGMDVVKDATKVRQSIGRHYPGVEGMHGVLPPPDMKFIDVVKQDHPFHQLALICR